MQSRNDHLENGLSVTRILLQDARGFQQTVDQFLHISSRKTGKRLTKAITMTPNDADNNREMPFLSFLSRLSDNNKESDVSVPLTTWQYSDENVINGHSFDEGNRVWTKDHPVQDGGSRRVNNRPTDVVAVVAVSWRGGHVRVCVGDRRRRRRRMMLTTMRQRPSGHVWKVPRLGVLEHQFGGGRLGCVQLPFVQLNSRLVFRIHLYQCTTCEEYNYYKLDKSTVYERYFLSPDPAPFKHFTKDISIVFIVKLGVCLINDTIFSLLPSSTCSLFSLFYSPLLSPPFFPISFPNSPFLPRSLRYSRLKFRAFFDFCQSC